MKRLLLLMLSVLAFQSPARGQEVLTWNTCVSIAQQKNPALQSALEHARSARASFKGSYWGFYPEITAVGGYAHGTSSTSIDPLSSQTAVERDGYSALLNVQQNLFNGFKDDARARAAQAALELAEAQLAQVSSTVGAELKTAYGNLVFAQKQVALSDGIEKRLKENLRLVKLRFDRGRENKGSMLTTKAAYAQAQVEASQARRLLKIAQADLARVLGRGVSTSEIRVADKFEFDPNAQFPKSLPDVKQLVPATPAHKEAVAQVKSSQASVTAAKSEFFPSLDAYAQFGKRDNVFPPDRDRWVVGVTLTIPLFDGFRDYYGVQAANNEERGREDNLRATDDQTSLDLDRALNDLQTTLENRDVQKELLNASETRVEIARNKYANGLLSFDDWDVIEKELITRQRQFLQSQRDVVSAQAKWEQVQGKSLGESEKFYGKSNNGRPNNKARDNRAAFNSGSLRVSGDTEAQD